ncbi:MAG: MBG domain-containing protein [Pirellulales bacterium]
MESRRVLTNFVSIANSLDTQLLAQQSRITTALNSFATGATSHIPIVGNKLGNALQVISSFDTKLAAGLTSLGSNATPTDAEIQTAIYGQLQGMLGADGNGGTDAVRVSHSGANTSIDMLLRGSTDVATLPFDVGLGGLPISFSAAGKINVEAGFAYALSFTFTSSNTVTLNGGGTVTGVTPPENFALVDANNPLAVFVSATLDDSFSAQARFGFVQGNAGVITGAPNGLFATALVSNLLTAPVVKLDGAADANLRLVGSFAGTADDFPGISADFHLHWGLSSSAPTSGAPSVAFDNVSLTYGTFLSNVLNPILTELKPVLDELKPVLKLLSSEVPGVSDLSQLAGAGPITVLDLASAAAQVVGEGPLADLVTKVVKISNILASLNVSSNISMPLGGFDLASIGNGDLRNAVLSGDISDLNLNSLTSLDPANLNAAARQAGEAYHNLVNSLGVSQEAKDELNSLVSIPNNGFQLSFPVLDNPAGVIFGMLLGRDSDLFFLKADADLTLDSQRASGFSAYGMPINYRGTADINMHLKFAYDTFGLRRLINHLAEGNTSDIFSDITDGFYIADTSYFKIAGGLEAFAGGSAGIFDFTVAGGLYTTDLGESPVSITIADPNSDGKLRFAEFDGGKAFVTSGELDGNLGVQVSIGTEILGKFYGIRKRFDIANTVLVYFGDVTPPVLASQPDAQGMITLYLGQNANLRTGQGLDQIDGDENFTIRHKADNPLGGEDIIVSAFGESQTIQNVRRIEAYDELGELIVNVLPGVTSDVKIVGGSGAANLAYWGTGTAELRGGLLASTLSGGKGSNVLIGGADDDTIVLGSGTNTVDGRAGHNTIVVDAPVLQSATVSGGDSPDNSLQILGNPNTFEISLTPIGAAIDVAITNAPGDAPVHLLMSHFGDVFISAQDSSTNFIVGDLSVAGITQLTMNLVAAFSTARSIDLETRAGSLSANVAVHPFENSHPDPQEPTKTVIEHGADIVNSTTGLAVRVIGFGGADRLTLRAHGGSLDFDPLGFTSGNFILDTSTRATSVGETVSIVLPGRADGQIVVSNVGGDVLMTVAGYTSFRIQGETVLDTLNVDVGAALSGANTVTVDASSVHGVFNLRMLGDASAIDHLTLSHVSPDASVSIFGQNTTSDLLFGTGQLALIQHDVNISNVQLAVDNSSATVGSLLNVNPTTFGSWVLPAIPGVTPQLIYSGLHGLMSIKAGAGDNFNLEATPASITSLKIENESKSVQDSIFIVKWAVPIAMTGNFSVFAGQRMLLDRTVERLKRLINIQSTIQFDYVGDGPSQVVFDGDNDPAGAQYTIASSRPPGASPSQPSGFVVANTTVGLTVGVSGYGKSDSFYVYLPGGTVDATLQQGPLSSVFIDGQARLAGTNAAAPNKITIAGRYGTSTMTPISEYHSQLSIGNDVHFLGSMPQDSLAVSIPSPVLITASQTNQLDIASNPSIFATVSGMASGRIYSWDDGGRPTFFLFANVTKAEWSSAGLGGLPNPFLEQPYGIIMPSEAADLTVTYHQVGVLNGVPFDNTREYSGKARGWLVDTHPVAPNNDVRLDASQLRGTFQFNVTGPDYDYVRSLKQAFKFAVTGSVSYNGFHTWGTPYDIPRISFGQSNIVLSNVHPELSVAVHSDNRNFAYTQNANESGIATEVPISTVVVSPYALTTLNVGNGVIGNIQGNVSADQVQLEVDDRNGMQPNILSLTSNTVSWLTSTGALKTLTASSLRKDLTLTGGNADRFAVSGTPLTEGKVLIRNLLPAVVGFESPGVYLMGNRAKQVLEVNGNLSLFVGRQLNTDGTVTEAGDVIGATSYAGGPTDVDDWHSISYNYTGAGRGILIYDSSQSQFLNFFGDISGDAGSQVAFHLGYAETYQGDLIGTAISAGNRVAFGPNTDFTLLQSQLIQFGTGFRIDNRTAASIRYILNPLRAATSFDSISVDASFGPLEIQGNRGRSAVNFVPKLTKDLLTSVTGDVTLSNIGATFATTTLGAPVPAVLPAIQLTDTQLTGVTGGVIRFANLADYSVPFGRSYPGLYVGLQSYGAASLNISNSGAGFTTAFETVANVPIGATSITGTTGTVRLNSVGFDADTSVIRREFRTTSLSVGKNGSMTGILGDVWLGTPFGFFSSGTVTIDDHLDTVSRNAEFAADITTSAVALSGLSIGRILWNRDLTSHVDVLGAPNSHYLISNSSGNMSLYAGARGTVDIYDPSRAPGASALRVQGLNILGADAVTFTYYPNYRPLTPAFLITPDPSRPNDVTDLKVDMTREGDGLTLDSAPGGLGRISTGSGASLADVFRFQANRTNLSLLGFAEVLPSGFTYALRVNDTPAMTTFIDTGEAAVTIARTSNPLEIRHRSTQPLILGSGGLTQSLVGPITIDVTGTTVPAAVTLDNSADSAAKTLILARATADQSTVSGWTAVPVTLKGTNYALRLKAGSGNNTFVGPDVASIWNVNAANGGVLSQFVTFSGMKNIVSGSGNDKFYFSPAGSLAGNLDAGAGTDTIYYQAGMLTGSDVIDLPNQRAPRVSGGTAGHAFNLESSGTTAPLVVTKPADVVTQVFKPFGPLAISATGGDGTRQFSATGLPDGIVLDTTTGVLSGTPTTELQFTTITITVVDATGAASTSFSWFTDTGLIVKYPGNQTSQVGTTISLPIVAQYTYGGTLTYSATGLPPGLTINRQTGVISGVIPDGTQSQPPYSVVITVTDGTRTAEQSFDWQAIKTFALINPGNQSLPELVPISIPIAVINNVGTVRYSAIGLPGNLTINPNTGEISGSIFSYNLANSTTLWHVIVNAFDSQRTVETRFDINVLPGFSVFGLFGRLNTVNEPVDFPISISNPYGANITMEVAGLPPGVTFTPATGTFGGRIDLNADANSPYHPIVTFTNNTFHYTYSLRFDWVIEPAIVITSPEKITSIYGDVVDLPIPLLRDLGSPVEFSAFGLPEGLSINPTTGRITGTIGAQSYSPFESFVVINASDAQGHVGYTQIDWSINSAANVAIVADAIRGTTIKLTSPVGTRLSVQTLADVSAGVLPPSDFSFPYGFFNFTIEGVDEGGAADLIIAGTDTSLVTDYFKLGFNPADFTYYWYDFLYDGATGMEIDGDTVILHLLDGGRGDLDLSGNGIIFDPGGPALNASTASPTTTVVVSDRPAGSVYGQTDNFSVTVTSASGTPTGKVQFQIDGVNFGAPQVLVNGGAAISTSGLNAANHLITALYIQDVVTFASSSGSVSQLVTPAPVTITADDMTKVYGAAVPMLTFVNSALVNGDTVATAFTGELASAVTTSTGVGDYPITQGTLAAANYAITYVGANLSVTQASVTVTADPQTKVYGAALPVLTFSASPLVNGDTLATAFTGTLATTATASSGVANYPITQGTLASTNYAITYVGANLSVTQASVTVTADPQTKVYGAAMPVLTFSASPLVNGDTQATAFTGGLATTATASSGVANYPITAGSLASANYAITYVGANLSVTQASVTVTADPQTKVYGAALPVLTFSASPLVNGDTLATAFTGSLATTATASSGVANYPITAGSLASANYAITYVGANLSVTQASVTVIADPQTKVYGAALPVLTFSASPLVNGDTLATAFTGTLATTATASSGVANYPITAGTLASTNYAITYVGASLNVAQAPLTITADNKSKPQGSVNPPLTYTANGFVNGDANASLATQPVLETTATTASGPGDYPITVSGAVAANYAITYVNGTLTVTGANNGTTTSIVSTANPSVPGQTISFTVTVSPQSGGGVPTGAVTIKDGATTLTTLSLTAGQASFSTAGLSLGPHALTAIYSGSSSYAGSSSTALTQTVKTVAVEPDPLDPSRNAIFIGGTVGNDTISVKPGSTKGTLQIDVTEANLDKYRYSGATGLANIARLIVFGGDGNDILQIASNVTLPSVLDGGAGNDGLVGGGGNDVLIGQAGNDVLKGNGGRDILIGGADQDALIAGSGQTVLIGGRTDFDKNLAALAAVMQEWSRTDLGYDGRVANLLNGGGKNGTKVLNATTVRDDNASDILYGGNDLDLFFAAAGDYLFNQTNKEKVVRP